MSGFLEHTARSIRAHGTSGPSVWVIQLLDAEWNLWFDAHTTDRFAEAIGIFNSLDEPKRFLRNGKVLRMDTEYNELDLFNEED